MLATFFSLKEGRVIMTAAVVLEVVGLFWMSLLLRRQEEY